MAKPTTGQYQFLEFFSQPNGIDTVTPHNLLGPNDLQTCKNFRVNDRRFYETRPGLTEVVSAACGADIVQAVEVPNDDGTTYKYFVDDDNKVYKVTGTSPSLAPGSSLKTLEGEAVVIPYNGTGIILDGSYLKQVDNATVSMLYDAGSGTNGYQFDNITGATSDSSAEITLYSGGNERAGTQRSTQSWDAGYTIPITSIKARMKKTEASPGNLTGSAYAKVYDNTGATLHATSDAVNVGTGVDTSYSTVTFNFTTQYNASPSTAYLFVIEFTGGDASNYLTLDGISAGASGEQVIWDGVYWEIGTGDVTDEGADLMGGNGGFADASAVAAGTALNSATVASVAGGASGNYLRITEAGTANPGWAYDVTTVAGTWYHVSGKVQAGTEATYLIRAKNGVTVLNSTGYLEETAGSWGTDVDLVFLARGTTTTLDLIQIATAGAGTTLGFDSFTVKKCTADYDMQIAVQPGRPPKGSFGIVGDNRLLVYDSTRPGGFWYSNAGSFLDWSTANAAGWQGVIDDDTNSFPVGGFARYANEVLIFGTQAQPYLARLDGTNPSTWALTQLFQETWTTYDHVIATANDVLFLNSANVHRLQDTQFYGDFRTGGMANQIINRIEDYWGVTAVVGHNPLHGQLWVKFASHDPIYIIHEKFPYQGPDGRPRYPITTYEFANLTPSWFGMFNGSFHVGCTDGRMYKLDSSVVKDDYATVTYEIEGATIESPMQSTEISHIYNQANSIAPASFDVNFYKDNFFVLNDYIYHYGTDDASVGVNVQLGSDANNVYAAAKITTPAFSSSSKVALYQMKARLNKDGPISGTIKAALYNYTTKTLIEESSNSVDVFSLTGALETFSFAGTTELSPSTDYMLVIDATGVTGDDIYAFVTIGSETATGETALVGNFLGGSTIWTESSNKSIRIYGIVTPIANHTESFSTGRIPLQTHLNMEFNALKLTVDNLSITKPLQIKSIALKTRGLGEVRS